MPEVEEYLLAEAKRMAEKELQSWVIRAARMAGWRAYHTFDSRRSAHGFPDLVLVWRGNINQRPPYTLIFAELKRQNTKRTSHQVAWGDDLTNFVVAVPGSPVRYVVWRPLDRLDGTIARALAGEGV